MQYQPSLPEHNDNVSHSRPLKEFLLLFSGIVGIFALIFLALTSFVDWAVDYISPEDEAKIYAKMNYTWQDKTEIASEQQIMLQRIVDDLGHCAQIAYPIRVYLIESEDANAMAFPGGHIVVLSGVLEKVKSENGLAFVLAHELSHFNNRDHLRALGGGIVIMALSVIFTGANSDISQLLAPTSELGQAQHSQSAERKADKTALQILNCHYGHVGGASEFFESLRNSNERFNFGALHYFSSHPELKARISDLNQVTKDMGFKVERVRNFGF